MTRVFAGSTNYTVAKSDPSRGLSTNELKAEGGKEGGACRGRSHALPHHPTPLPPFPHCGC